MLNVNGVVPAPKHRALDHVTQLADVAGPGIGEQHGAGPTVDPPDILPVLGAEAPQEMLGEDKGIVAPLPQRGKVEEDHGQTEVQVAPEAAVLHLPLEVAIGCRQNAHVDLAVTDPADSSHHSLFNCSKQLPLK